MALEIQEGQIRQKWSRWLSSRNRNGAFWVALQTTVLYPLFGWLDTILFSRDQVVLFWIVRVIVTALTILIFLVIRTRWGERFHVPLSALITLLTAGGIVFMVAHLGGMKHPYYAGINLVMIGTGLLFLWPPVVTLGVYLSIVLAYLVVGTLVTEWRLSATSLSNLFFLVSTSVLVIAGHIFSYRSQYRQVRTNYLLERTKESLQRAHDEMVKLDRFKTEFFQNITHELQTPLTMILPPLELMKSGDLGTFSEEQIATIDTMSRNAWKLSKLIRDLLEMAKLQDAKIRLKITELDFRKYVSDLVETARPLTDRKGIQMTFHSDNGEMPLWIDPDRMERVLVNLLSNASKYAPVDGHIDIRLLDEGDSVHLSIQDDGPGFPPEYKDRIFERFFQVDSGGNRKYGGTGIGLALARELVLLHEGEIWAEGDVGKGATFHLRLRKGRSHFRPEALDRRQRPQDVPGGQRTGDRSVADWSQTIVEDPRYRLLDIAEATERRVVERDPGEERRPYTVLVVEDTLDVIRLIHLTLRSFARIVAAEDGPKGLELAQKIRPDLVITDLMMPGMDGRELTRRLRQDESLKTIPIIMLTARGDVEDQVAGIESGVTVYLTKPFLPRVLLSQVRTLLNIRESEADVLMTGTMDQLAKVSGGLAHEINNPLNYLKNSLALIRSDFQKLMGWIEEARKRPLTEADTRAIAVLDERAQKMFQTAEGGIRRIAWTVELMKQYSREGYTRRRVHHDVFAAVREVMDVVLPAMGREVTVTTDLEGQAMVLCVPEEMHQVISNLLQNAIEACPETGGRVQVTGRVSGDEVELRFQDNGPGVPREIRQRLFAPFFTTKGPGKGMGLGLTIVWRAIQGMNGRIEVEGEEGEGAIFRVRLPLVIPPSPDTQQSRSSGPRSGG